MRINVNDESLCGDCELCREACAQATGREPSLYLIDTGTKVQPAICRQCQKAPCIAGCSTGALSYQAHMVYLNHQRCIRCGLCEIACPFGLIQLNARGEPVKCNLCRHVPVPPCVQSCPRGNLKLVE